ncbi:MAG: transcriptional regulator [Alphaproteobacteria bacterium 32-64-14]|nr:MAG: transcriptional regulator [Alphaproteobacteria bacterium 32-64-14]
MDVRARVGANMRRAREALGVSQEELADRARIHRTYISGVERGVRNPTVTVLEKIAKALKVKTASLLE